MGGSRPSPVRVVLVDGNPLMRLGVCTVLETHRDIRVVGQAPDSAGALRLARSLQPDVVLLDVRTTGLDGVSSIAGAATVVVLSAVEDGDTVARAIEAGARGYLVHGTYDLEQFLTAVLGAAEGLPCASPGAATALVQAVRRRPPPVPADGARAVGALSIRECDVMRLIAEALTNDEIGRRLGLTEKTVKNHLQSIYTKLDVHSRSEALSSWLGATLSPDGSSWVRRPGQSALPAVRRLT